MPLLSFLRSSDGARDSIRIVKFPVAQVTYCPHLKTHRPAESRLGELGWEFPTHWIDPTLLID